MHGNRRLTSDQVRQVRAMYRSGSFTQQYLAKKFGIAQFAISMIVRHVTYKDVV